MCRVLGIAEFPAERSKGRRVFVIAVNIAQQAAERLEGRRVDAAVTFQACRAGAARRFSSVQPALATPMTGTFRLPRPSPWPQAAGKIFLNARSPVAPKNTSASEGV